MSSSSTSAPLAVLNGQVTEKLTWTNYVLWRVQVTPQLIGAGVFGYAEGTIKEQEKFIVTKDKDGKESASPNPLHQVWVREDQQVLAYLLVNLSREVLVQVTNIHKAHELWAAVANMFCPSPDRV